MEEPASPVSYEIYAQEVRCGHNLRSEGMFVWGRARSRKTDLYEAFFVHKPSIEDLEWHNCLQVAQFLARIMYQLSQTQSLGLLRGIQL